jgi:hypothetical protein
MALKRAYRHYALLVDLCFWLSLFYCLRMAGKMTGLLPVEFPPPFRSFFAIAVAANFALAIFVVVAKFMRDEHAERIWHLAAQRFVYFLMVVPMVIAIALTFAEGQVQAAARSQFVRELLQQTGPQTTDPGSVMVFGVGLAVIVFATCAPVVFVFIYKWCLWRDGR